jgi:hypothetical protein
MNVKAFWKRGKDREQHQQQEPVSSVQNQPSGMQKRQNLVWRESNLCATIPQKAVNTLHISTKRFLKWQPKTVELVGILFLSETVATTRIEQLSHKEQYLVIVPPVYVRQYGLKATKKGGPPAIFEWDEESLQVRIPIEKKRKPANRPNMKSK